MRRLSSSPSERVRQIYQRFLLVMVLASPIWVTILAFPLALFLMPGPHDTPRIVNLIHGKSLPLISSHLKARGVLHSGTVFRIGVRMIGATRRLKAGEYHFKARANMWTIIRKLARGDVFLHKVKIIEGTSSKQIVMQLNANPILRGTINFTPLEGSLLPETYLVPRNMMRIDLIHKMQTAMTTSLNKLWEKRLPGLPFRASQEALILASIVEKETGIDHERGLIAAVFINRLQAGMRLQSDPTIIYGMTLGRHRLARALTDKDIARSTPYNTYIIRGLPPTPISNPGHAAIAAVLSPPVFEALYFVADGRGGHFFANTLTEHNRNVRKWHQRQQRQ